MYQKKERKIKLLSVKLINEFQSKSEELKHREEGWAQSKTKTQQGKYEVMKLHARHLGQVVA
jgi:hypothetical protein